MPQTEVMVTADGQLDHDDGFLGRSCAVGVLGCCFAWEGAFHVDVFAETVADEEGVEEAGDYVDEGWEDGDSWRDIEG